MTEDTWAHSYSSSAEEAGPGSASGQTQSGGPVGGGAYEVQPGDCIESIAFDHGHFWETVWKHPDNQELKSARKDPNVLLAGDKVFIPDLRLKNESAATEQRHRFKRKGVPSKLCLVLKRHGKPRANLPYVLDIDGQIFSSQTNAQGRLEHPLSPNAKHARLVINEPGLPEEVIELQLGHLDPVDEVSGAKARLKNLGYYGGAVTGQMDPETKAAIQAFQGKFGLPETGRMDHRFQEQLKKEFGS